MITELAGQALMHLSSYTNMYKFMPNPGHLYRDINMNFEIDKESMTIIAKIKTKVKRKKLSNFFQISKPVISFIGLIFKLGIICFFL